MAGVNPFMDLVPELEQDATTDIPAAANPFMDLVPELHQDATFRASTTLALDANPDEVARQKRVAKLLDVSPAAVEALPDEMGRRARMQQIEHATADSPALRQAFTSADFAKLAHDDVENLSLAEKALRGFGEHVLRPIGGEGVGRFEQGVFGLAAAGASVLEWAASPLDRTLLPGNPFTPLAKGLQSLSNEGKLWADTYGVSQGDYKSELASGIASGTASLWQSLLLMPLALEIQGVKVAGGAAALPSAKALLPMGAVTAGTAYTDANDEGLSLGQRLAYAGTQGGIEMVTEALPFGGLVRGINQNSPFLSLLANQLVTENVGEQVATHWQDLNEWLTLNPEKTLGDYLDARPNAALQTAIATTFATGLQTSALRLATNVAEHRRDEANAQKAEANAQHIEALNQAAKASKTLQRDAATVESFVAAAAAEGADSFYIGARELMQTGVGEAVARLSPTAGQQVEEALATGGMVRIPMSEYTAYIAPTEYAQSLVDHLRTEPAGFSRAEALEWKQTEGEQLRTQVEQVLAEAQVSTEFRESQNNLKQLVLGELNNVNRFTPEKNEFDAELIVARTAVRAAQLNLSPEQMFEKQLQRLTVQAESPVGGRVLNQEAGGLPQVVAGIEAEGLKLNASERNGVITLSRIVVPEDGRNQGAGTAAMERLIAYADATGQRVALSPSADFGGNKKRLTEFYGRFGFKPNKGKSRDLAVSEAMIRAPQQRAFNQTDGVESGGTSGVDYLNGQQTLESRLEQWRTPLDPDGRGGISLVAQEWAESSSYAGEHGSTGFTAQTKEGRAEQERLIATAKENGFFFDDNHPIFDDLTAHENQGGAEHDVYIVGAPQDRVVIRSTIPGSFGNTSTDSPVAYLKRLKEYNQLFPSLQVRVIGVSQHDDGTALVWTAQQFIAGEEFATQAQLDAAMRARGWFEVGTNSHKYRHKVTGAVIEDVHRGNVLHIGDELFPIDVIVEKLPGGEQGYRQGESAQVRGSFNPDTTVMTLLKGANLSTFLHEAGHYFFEADIALASELVSNGRTFGEDSHTEGERQILADVSSLLTWHGIRGPIEDQLRQWHNLDFEEKRTHHERFAESFEAYLFEGKAPSIELQPYFRTFRQWLVSVYSTLKAFIEKHPEAGKLNDEVRGIFDRMLATDEQIALAEQSRSLMPLFATPEASGMTAEGYAALQALGAEATATATEQLQARALRDLQWTRNARGRKVKELQKQAKARRAELRLEVRREVMSQPIYRAWQFLTGKISADDKINSVASTKTNRDVVDPAQDSLFVAVAKLGGLDRALVEADGWVDAKARSPMPLFGKYVLRREGGKTPDGMAEALAELGYLPVDEHGKYELGDLADAFAEELRGTLRYSTAYDVEANRELKAGEQLANPQSLTAGRLDEASLIDMGLPEVVTKTTQERRMTANKGGLHPDLVADLITDDTGRPVFTSGDELVRKLADAQPPLDKIEALTDQRLLERYGDLATPEAIEKAADIAIHNEVRGRHLATEANALAQATGQPKILAEAAKAYAATMMARLKVRDIRPHQYASAEVRAAKASAKAGQAGDLATAAAEKRNQIIQFYATRAAYEAQEEVEKTVRKWAAFARRADDKLKRGYDIDMVNAVRAILGQYGIAEKQGKRAAEYLKAVESYDPEMYAMLRPSVEAAEANATPYREMTVESLRGLRDEIDSILHLARRSREMEVGGDRMDREDVEDALREQIEVLGIPDRIPGEGQAVTPGEAGMAKIQALVAFATRMENWTERMDAGKPLGPFQRFVFGVVKEAATRYRADKAAHLKRFRELVEGIAPTLKPQIIAAPELGYTFGKDSGGSAINEILHAILHTGNDSNRRKLLLGRGWATEQEGGIMDASRWDAFVARMIAEGKITPAHFDFVQGVWDLLESTKPLAQKTHRDVFGKYFDEVTANEFVDLFGTVRRGGYVPAMVDSRVVKDAELRSLADQDNAGMAYAFPTTPKGFTKSRVEYNRPLLLDLRTLAQHIDKVLLFSHMEMPVRDVQRVLSGKVGSGINRLDPAAMSGLILPWLNRSARQQVETPVAGSAGTMRFFSVMRSRAGAAAMFGNLANAIQQVTGFSMASVKVKPALMIDAVAAFMKDPKGFASAVHDSSLYMAGRMENEVAAMSDAINDILLNPSLIERGQAWASRHAYFLQSGIDSVMSPIIWTAAYNQAAAAGSEHEDAVRQADGVVRTTQGSTLPEDISRIEGGNAFVRLFTQFAGYFNMQANLLGTEFANVMRQYGLRAGAGKGLYIFTMGFLIPAVVGEAVIQAFRGGPEDEDDDGYLDDWLAALFGWAPLRNATAMLPGVGQGINSAVNAWNSKPYDDRLASSPAISMIEASARAPVSVYKALAGDGNAQKAVRDMATLISMTVGLPANLAARPLGYAAGVANADIGPTGPLDALRGTVTGIASRESRQ